MTPDAVSLISLLIGLVSFAASIVFFNAASRAEQRNREILDMINAAIQTWQGRIMDSSIELLNSRVEIVGSRISLEDAKVKHAFIVELSERIRHIIENPASEESTRQLQTQQLGMLLQAFEATTKGVLPPEVLAQIVAKTSQQ